MANRDAAIECRELARACLKEEQPEKAVRLFEKAARMAQLPGIEEEIAAARAALSAAETEGGQGSGTAQGRSSTGGGGVESKHAPSPEPALSAEAGAAMDRLLLGGSYYQVLGVQPHMPGVAEAAKELKRAYFRLSRLVHPDKCAHPRATEVFQLVQTAYTTLSDPAKHLAYRATLTPTGKPVGRPMAAAPPQPAAPPSVAALQLQRELASVSAADLRALCRRSGLPQSGRKDQLVAKLASAFAAYGDLPTCQAKMKAQLAQVQLATSIEGRVARAPLDPTVWNSLGALRSLLGEAAACGLTTSTSAALRVMLQASAPQRPHLYHIPSALPYVGSAQCCTSLTRRLSPTPATSASQLRPIPILSRTSSHHRARCTAETHHARGSTRGAGANAGAACGAAACGAGAAEAAA
jgi:hypothetical protein